MARVLDRIWVRFGLGIAATVLVTVGLLAAGLAGFAEWQYRSFYRGLPPTLQKELDRLEASQHEDNPRIAAIYSQYGGPELLLADRWPLLVALLACLPLGLAVGFWVSRLVTLPLASMAEAANRIALGDLSVRAAAGPGRGEMADMVRDFNRMTDALQRLEHERRSTAAALSHELRTPLAVLTAHMHALRDGVIPAEPAEFERLLDQLNHLSRLVEDMHTLTLADGGRLSLDCRALDLVALADEMIAMFGERAARFGMPLVLTASAPHVPVHADRDRLRQILSNLLDNALRHARGATRIEVQVGVEAQRAVLRVSDDGPGLPEAVRRRPFERFQGRGTAGAGSGLGLSIVAALAASQGGVAEAGASPGGGACITVRLPQAPAAGAQDDED